MQYFAMKGKPRGDKARFYIVCDAFSNFFPHRQPPLQPYCLALVRSAIMHVIKPAAWQSLVDPISKGNILSILAGAQRFSAFCLASQRNIKAYSTGMHVFAFDEESAYKIALLLTTDTFAQYVFVKIVHAQFFGAGESSTEMDHRGRPIANQCCFSRQALDVPPPLPSPPYIFQPVANL